MNKINEMKMTFGFSSSYDTLYVKMGNTYLQIRPRKNYSYVYFL